jgi:hypothetical protein
VKIQYFGNLFFKTVFIPLTVLNKALQYFEHFKLIKNFMKKIMLFCLTLIAFSAMTNAQTRGAKTGKIEQAQTRAANTTSTTPPAAGKPAKESKESIEAADQKDRDEAENGGDKKDKVKTMLGLSDEQNAQFKAIVAELRQAVKAIKKDATIPQADKMAKIKTLNDARDAKLKGIFTAEQFTKWVELAKNMGSNNMGKGRHKSDK